MHFETVLTRVRCVVDRDGGLRGRHRAGVGIDGHVAERRAERVDAGRGESRERHAVGRTQEHDRADDVAQGSESGVRGRRDRTGVHVARVGNDDGLRSERAGTGAAEEFVERACQQRGGGRIERARDRGFAHARAHVAASIRTGSRRAPQVPLGPSKRPGRSEPQRDSGRRR